MLRGILFGVLGLVLVSHAVNSIAPRDAVVAAQMSNARQYNTNAFGAIGQTIGQTLGLGVSAAANALNAALYGTGGTGADYIGSYNQLAYNNFISQYPLVQPQIYLPNGYQQFQLLANYNQLLQYNIPVPISNNYVVVCDVVYSYDCYFYYYNPSLAQYGY